MSKFTCDAGKGNWELRAKIHKPEDSDTSLLLKLSIYLDGRWDDALTTNLCKGKLEYARGVRELSIPMNGEYSEMLTGSFSQTSPHVWYVAISDCDGHLTKSQGFQLEVHFINSDNTEFSTDDQSLLIFYFITFLLFFMILLKNIASLLRTYKKNFEITPNLLMLNIAITSEFVGVTFEVIHLAWYSYNGKGLNVFDFFYHCFSVISGLIISFLFLIMADG